MILTGIDIVSNERFEKLVKQEGFLQKVFSPSELREKSKLAGKFALKEAAMKALGRKVDWKEIEIISRNGKKPEIKLGDVGINVAGIDGSVSHDGECTVASVVMEI